MDGMPGLIHSGDDFGLNSAGIMITETTISQFSGFDPDGVPEFVRARKAMQYAASIDDFARIMKDGNNGGYANNWLVADRKTNEVASLELGLKNVTLQRTRDGFFVGSNFPVNEKLMREETEFDPKNAAESANARHTRWLQIMEQNKGKIDAHAAERFLADHFDTYENKVDANERTLCGHLDLSPRGWQPWAGPYAPTGAVQNKVSDAAMAESMTMRAALGHSCGIGFKAAAHLRKHTEFAWQRPAIARHAVAPLDDVYRTTIGSRAPVTLRPLIITVQVMFDQGAHAGKGLTCGELAKFRAYQDKAQREYAVSGIRFNVRTLEGAYLRQQGYSEIPGKFLARGAINLFVTDTLGYDLDRDRTGGCSMGPRPPSRRSGGDPFYKSFLGLRDARDTTLPHEYAHHFTLDTQRDPTAAANFWADLRNDYWLWLQRRGMTIMDFRACAHAEWAVPA